MGAWIEMPFTILIRSGFVSLPSWERGLKYRPLQPDQGSVIVAPLVGAWIEIMLPPPIRKLIAVAPLVGAWIEIPGF